MKTWIFQEDNNLCLGRWLEKKKSFQSSGQLPAEWIEKLESLGYKGELDRERNVECTFELLCNNNDQYGHVSGFSGEKIAKIDALGMMGEESK